MPTLIRESAPAKLNLMLHLQGRRADGYHLLQSLVTFADVQDVVEVTAADTLNVNVHGEFTDASGGAGESNLVFKAARLLQSETGATSGAAITLTKSIPVGAGLGGGSADAAATLRALNRLWHTGLTDAQLETLGTALGADVAMCVRSRAVMISGIGEVLTPLPAPLPPFHAVLVHPRTPLLTADVYRACAELPVPPLTPLDPVPTSYEALIRWLHSARNDLQEPATRISGPLCDVLGALHALEPKADIVRMTGSGACCFALYSTAAHAAEAAQQLTGKHPNWWVRAAAISC